MTGDPTTLFAVTFFPPVRLVAFSPHLIQRVIIGAPVHTVKQTTVTQGLAMPTDSSPSGLPFTRIVTLPTAHQRPPQKQMFPQFVVSTDRKCRNHAQKHHLAFHLDRSDELGPRNVTRRDAD
jgi:hypothetical protein